MLTAEQIAAAQKANLNTMFGLTTKAFEGMEKLVELNIQAYIECRVTALGHVQRGAPPTANDRILASAFGVYAVDLIEKGKFDKMVAYKNRKIIDVTINEAIKTYKNVERNDPLVETALSLGIYIGDIK